MKLSDYVVKFFEAQRLEHMFMVTGGGCMHLVNSFGNSSKINYVCMHHEQSAAMAAEAYAKMNNCLGLVLVTSGPGATNTITGLLGAFQDSVPCVFISGQAKRQQTVYNSGIEGLRQFGVQEANIIPIVQSITKYAVMINDPQKIRYYLEKSLYLAKNGRPGPVWLDIPLDVQSATINEADLKGYCAPDVDMQDYNYSLNEQVKLVSDKLSQCKRPVIIAGHGIRIANACEELEKLCSNCKIPVVTPFMGIDNLSSSHMCNIGRVGTKGTRAGNFAMQNADVIISIGSRLPVSVIGHEYNKFAPNAYKIVIDIDEKEHSKKTIIIDKFILADAKVFIELLLLELQKKEQNNFVEWLTICNGWKSQYPVCLDKYNDDTDGVNYYKFVDELSKILSPDVTVISDAGSAFYAVSQALNLKQGQRYITSGAIATMGFSLPAAIGVTFANNNRFPVVAITGDGSFQQTIQELEVMKFKKLPIKLFVMNNNGYFSIRQTQGKFFAGNLVGESQISGISFPDTKKIAWAYGINYISCSCISDIQNLYSTVFENLEPIIIEVKLTQNQEIIPTNSSKLCADGIMVSTSLEDMYPFLPPDELKKNTIV